jgi:purine-binding chemotaxis protein CheW
LQEQKQPEQEAQPVPPAAASAADQIVESPGPAGTVPESQPPAPAADAEAQTARDTAAGTAPVAEGPAEAASEQQVQQVQEIEMLSFRLGGEEYALMVEDVKEVLKSRELTQVPNAPDYILGVTALRGPILAVIDLSRRLGLPPAQRGEKSRILVVSSNDEDTGMVVDRVTGVVKIHPEDIRPVPETIVQGSEFLRGIVRKNDRLYILLDREKALGA